MFLSPIASRAKARWNHPQGYRAVMKVGLPMVASMASATVMQFTDRLFLSHYSLDAIAASLPAANLSLTCFLTLSGLCGYTAVLISHYWGAEQNFMIGPALWQGLWCAFAGCLLLLAFCLAAGPVFDWAGHDPGVRSLEVDYFRILNVGACFSLLAGVLSTFLYGRGFARPVMLASILAAVVNIPLDYLLIYGVGIFPEWGIRGAGVATGIGAAVNFFFIFFLVFRKNNSRYNIFSGWRPNWGILKKLLRFGVPSAINFFVDLGALAWFSLEMGKLGVAQLAAGTIAFSLNSVLFLPLVGLSMAISTLAGKAMGRGKPDEAEILAKSSLHVAIAYTLPLCLALFVFADPLVGFFQSQEAALSGNSPEVHALGVSLLSYVACYGLADACTLTFVGLLKGVGDTVAVLLMMSASAFGVLILPILLMERFSALSIHALWAMFTAYAFVLAASAFVRFKRGKWKGMRIISENM